MDARATLSRALARPIKHLINYTACMCVSETKCQLTDWHFICNWQVQLPFFFFFFYPQPQPELTHARDVRCMYITNNVKWMCILYIIKRHYICSVLLPGKAICVCGDALQAQLQTKRKKPHVDISNTDISNVLIQPTKNKTLFAIILWKCFP